MLSPADQANFEHMAAAAKNDDLMLIEAREKATGEMVPLVVALAQDGDEFAATPYARLLRGDPYDEYDPPEFLHED